MADFGPIIGGSSVLTSYEVAYSRQAKADAHPFAIFFENQRVQLCTGKGSASAVGSAGCAVAVCVTDSIPLS